MLCNGREKLEVRSLVWGGTVVGMAGMKQSFRASMPSFCNMGWCAPTCKPVNGTVGMCMC